ncbi:MAG: tetrahydromethanopterin S-methyltransferase subunit A [Candidatus Thermoplasmatota archaeon]
MDDYYPWGGDFVVCQRDGCVAVVLLNTSYKPPDTVAIYGHLKTENIGIEKIVANVISNPHIRYLVLCGEDIKGHRAGASLVQLHRNGIDPNHKIIEAPGVLPYIENLDEKAVERFQKQIKIIDMIGENDKNKIDDVISKCNMEKPSLYGEPYIAIRIKPRISRSGDTRALHSRVIIDYTGRVKSRGG